MLEQLADLMLPFLETRQADGFLFSGAINRHSADQMVQVVEEETDRRTNAYVFLTTGGGDPSAAYRIGRTLRRSYDKGQLSFFIGGYCKSAGSLLALCADELVFSSYGELGPLDVQIGKPNELVGADSGLDLTQALKQLSATAFESFESQLVEIVQRSGGAISTKMAAGLAAELTLGIMGPIAAQVDPLRLGYSWRANQIGVHYGNLLKGKNVKDDTVNKLVNGYPAHEVVIDEAEARLLFENVRHYDQEETAIFEALRFLLRIPVATSPFITSFRTDFRSMEPTESISSPTNLHTNEGRNGHTNDVGINSSQSTAVTEVGGSQETSRSSIEGAAPRGEGGAGAAR